jgi:transcriptional regulator with XRE-family HTH domain
LLESQPMTVGEQIRARREAKRLTLAGLAERIGRNKSTVLRYETGELSIRLDELQRIADALGCDVRVLIPKRRRAA